jgi:hypothetical protein
MRSLPGKGVHSRRLIAAAAALALLGAVGAGIGIAKKKHHGGGLPRGPYPAFGCPVFPKPSVPANAPVVGDESAWNQDISQAPVDPNSANYIAYINSHGGTMLHPDFGSPREYGFPYQVVGKRQKRTKVNFIASPDESDRGPYRVPFKAMVEGGQTSDGDRHVLTVDGARCKLDELYRAFARKGRKGHWDADSGVIWDLNSTGLRPDGFTSADAAGLPMFPGLVRFDEAASGHINHAFRVTVNTTQDAFIHPAVHCASTNTDPNAPPMGLRLRLSAGYDVSRLTGTARVIAQALKQYGMVVADNGSNYFFSGTSDRRWDDDNLDQLKAIPGSAFQVVQSSAPVHRCVH